MIPPPESFKLLSYGCLCTAWFPKFGLALLAGVTSTHQQLTPLTGQAVSEAE
ncbi:MAG: hypothetical protein AAGA83_27240 [Cyanobacteria bacterium P01_F01_bin.116]